MKVVYNDGQPAKPKQTIHIVLEGQKEEFIQFIDALLQYPVESVQKLGSYLNKASKVE